MPYKDPEKRKAFAKENYAKNRERLRPIRRAWYLNNQDKVAASLERNREKRKRRLHERKPEINAGRRQRYAENAEYRAKILDRVRSRTWDVPIDEYDEFISLYDENCFYCDGPGGAVDHLMPRSRGGEDRLYNLVPACQPCNSSKGTNTPQEWYAKYGSKVFRPKYEGSEVDSGSDSSYDWEVPAQD